MGKRMKMTELKLLVVSLLQRVEALEHGEIWTDAPLEDLSPRVRQLESEKDNAQQAIATLLERIQQLEQRQPAYTQPSPPWWQPPYIVTCQAAGESHT